VKLKYSGLKCLIPGSKGCVEFFKSGSISTYKYNDMKLLALTCDEDNCCIYEKLIQITHSLLTSTIGYNRVPCMGVSSLLRMYMTTLFADVKTLMMTLWMVAVILV